MSPLLVLSSVLFYFVLLFGISYWSGRKADNQGFFTGNRKSAWYLVAFAMIGASISGVTFISVPGMVEVKSFSYLQMVIGFAVGYCIIAFVLIPLFYKMNVTSIYEYLKNRLGIKSYRTGAWFFFISKMLGAAVRFFLVCLVLQSLFFDTYNIPFVVNVIISVFIIWLYTVRGGVKSVIWIDSLKTLALLVSVFFCFYYIAKDLGLNIPELFAKINNTEYSKIFFFEDGNDPRFFFKQFFAGVFTAIAMTGLDQDMMQKTLSCKNPKDSQKNLITSGILQIFIVGLFLILGAALFLFSEHHGVSIPAESDKLFPIIATEYFPPIIGFAFVFGLAASAYAAAGSAMTALTTSFTIDILQKNKTQEGGALAHTRKIVHIGMALIMIIIIVAIYLLNNTSVINAVYVLASYTYGPILGLFTFGILTKIQVKDHLIPLVAFSAPVISYIIDSNSEQWFNGYKFSYELLIMNAAITFIGMLLIAKKTK